MACLSLILLHLLAVGQSLHDVMLLQYIALEIVRGKEKEGYCRKQQHDQKRI